MPQKFSLREIILIFLILLVIVWLLSREAFLDAPLGFASVASGEPVPYHRKPCPSGSICLRRWRDPVPVNNELGPPRQVTDDTWDRTYASGIGFQLY